MIEAGLVEIWHSAGNLACILLVASLAYHKDKSLQQDLCEFKQNSASDIDRIAKKLEQIEKSYKDKVEHKEDLQEIRNYFKQNFAEFETRIDQRFDGLKEVLNLNIKLLESKGLKT